LEDIEIIAAVATGFIKTKMKAKEAGE